MSANWDEAEGAPPTVLVETREGVAIVTLNRPDRLNAWTTAMGELYFETLERLGADATVRTILVTGQGRAFCAGIDLGGLAGLVGSDRPKPSPNAVQRPYYFPMTVGKPIVAAIQGPCYGVGLQQALCCDVRFAADDAKLAAPYVKRGLIGEVGMTWTLSRLIGLGPAMEIMLSGRALSAEEALRMGLVTRVVPREALFDAAFAYCLELAETCSPWSMRAIKLQMVKDMMDDLPGAYARSQALMQEALDGPDLVEGMRAFGEKRKPSFAPLAADLATIGFATDGD